MTGTPFKMKGFSGFGNSPVKQDEKMMKKEGKIKQTVTPPHPKHPATPPSKKETETSKGTVKGITGFEQDVVNPSKHALLTAAEKIYKGGKTNIHENLVKGFNNEQIDI